MALCISDRSFISLSFFHMYRGIKEVVFSVAVLDWTCLRDFVYYSVSQKIPLRFSDIFPKRIGIFNKFLHTYCAFLSKLDYKFLFNYLQLWRSYVILSATTQRIFTFH